MGKASKKLQRRMAEQFKKRAEALKASGGRGWDLAKIEITDIEEVTLSLVDNAMSVLVQIPIGDNESYAPYTEEIDFDDGVPDYLEHAARTMAAAALRAVKERLAVSGELPCKTCTGACCGRAVEALRLTREDLDRLEAAGLTVEQFKEAVELYETEQFSGHVGELKLVESPDGEGMQCCLLEPHGCRIYEHRPMVCREFSAWDCDIFDPDPAKLDGLVQLGVPGKKETTEK